MDKQSLRSPVMNMEERDLSPLPPGFRILLAFHAVFGVCYFGLVTNPIVKFLTLTSTLVFVVCIILFSLPCVVNCAFTWGELFEWGLSPKLLSFIVIGLDVYHAVMSCLIIGSKSRRLRDFFERSSDYCETFGVNLLPAQRTKLTSVAVKLVFLNLLHLVMEVCLMTLVVPQKVVAKRGQDDGKGQNNGSVDREILYPIVLFVRVLSVIYSKVIESNLIFLVEYVTMIVQRLEMRYDKFVFRNTRGRDGQSIEVGKVAFIEIQNLIKEADEVFAHTAFDPLFIDVLIVLLGLLEFCDGVTRRRQVSREDFHELFNAFASLVSIYMCCASGDCIESEMKEVVQSICYINAERFTERDYKSIVFSITGLTVVLLSSGIRTPPE